MLLREDIIKAAKLHESRVYNIYIFGSRVYGTFNSKSDWDIVVVAKSHYSEVEYSVNNMNIHLMSIDRFNLQLSQHNIRNIECLMAPGWAILQENHNFNFQLKLKNLRHSISRLNSNSWVKCKKKLLDGEYHIGVKSLWHSMRAPIFGIQIAKYGKITDFTAANYLWDEISSNKWNWDMIDNRFKSESNQLMSEFRKVASKF